MLLPNLLGFLVLLLDPGQLHDRLSIVLSLLLNWDVAFTSDIVRMRLHHFTRTRYSYYPKN